jgi:hypothetical protein
LGKKKEELGVEYDKMYHNNQETIVSIEKENQQLIATG